MEDAWSDGSDDDDLLNLSLANLTAKKSPNKLSMPLSSGRSSWSPIRSMRAFPTPKSGVENKTSSNGTQPEQNGVNKTSKSPCIESGTRVRMRVRGRLSLTGLVTNSTSLPGGVQAFSVEFKESETNKRQRMSKNEIFKKMKTEPGTPKVIKVGKTLIQEKMEEDVEIEGVVTFFDEGAGKYRVEWETDPSGKFKPLMQSQLLSSEVLMRHKIQDNEGKMDPTEETSGASLDNLEGECCCEPEDRVPVKSPPAPPGDGKPFSVSLRRIWGGIINGESTEPRGRGGRREDGGPGAAAVPHGLCLLWDKAKDGWLVHGVKRNAPKELARALAPGDLVSGVRVPQDAEGTWAWVTGDLVPYFLLNDDGGAGARGERVGVRGRRRRGRGREGAGRRFAPGAEKTEEAQQQDKLNEKEDSSDENDMQKQHKVVYPSQLKWARDLPCRILTDSELISLIDQLVGFDLPLPPGKVAVQYFNEAEECQVLDTSVLKDYDFEDPDGKGLRWSVDLSNQNFKKCKRKKGAGWPKSQTKWDELMARALEALKEALQNAKAAENATAWNQRQRAIKSPSATTARPGKRPRTAAPSGPLNQNSGQKAKQKLIDHDVQSTGLSMAKSNFSLRAGDVVSWNEFILGRRNSVQDQIKEVHKSKNREDSYIVTHNRNHRLNGDESVQLVARRKRGKLEDVRSQKIIFTVEQFKLDDKVPKGLEFEVNLEHLRLAQAIENTAKDIEKEGKKLGFTGEFVKDLSRNTMNF